MSLVWKLPQPKELKRKVTSDTEDRIIGEIEALSLASRMIMSPADLGSWYPTDARC
jgi:hypothetical protein